MQTDNINILILTFLLLLYETGVATMTHQNTEHQWTHMLLGLLTSLLPWNLYCCSFYSAFVN